MDLAALLIPPSLDPQQALRLRRFGLAALSYVVAAALIAVGWMLAMFPASAVPGVAAAFVAINLVTYVTIRSGFNLRFNDPSLTRFQILTAITVLMYIVFHLDSDRHIVVSISFFVLLFGVFRLNAREYRLITLYTLAAYALVINLVMHLRPQAIYDVPGEWMSWLIVAGFLPCFAIIGDQMNSVRRGLRESEARFRGLTEMSSDFFWESDLEHRLVQRTANRSYAAGSVFGGASPVGQRRWDIPYLSPDESAWRKHRETVDAHLPFRDFEFSRRASDGSERYIAISGDPVFDASGAFKGYRGVGADVTARKHAEQTIRESAESLRLFADNVPAMTVYLDQNLRYRFANKRYAEFFGADPADIVGRHLREIIGEEAYGEVEGHFARVLQGFPVTYQRTRKPANGEPHFIEVKLLPHSGDHGKVLGCFAVTTDITEHKLTEERIQRVAHHDSLTGLPNRLLFGDRLDQTLRLAKRDSRQFALLYLDLDRFKPVNDTLGHTAGDELLQAVAARIRREVRESDTVARVGGDEFAVILPDIGKREEAETVARKIIDAVAAPFQLGSQRQSIDIGTSIGIAIYPADAGDADALVNAADAAMYRAKQVGSSFRFCEA